MCEISAAWFTLKSTHKTCNLSIFAYRIWGMQMMAMTKRSGDGGRSRFALEFSHLSPFGERLRLQLVYEFSYFQVSGQQQLWPAERSVWYHIGMLLKDATWPFLPRMRRKGLREFREPSQQWWFKFLNYSRASCQPLVLSVSRQTLNSVTIFLLARVSFRNKVLQERRRW